MWHILRLNSVFIWSSYLTQDNKTGDSHNKFELRMTIIVTSDKIIYRNLYKCVNIVYETSSEKPSNVAYVVHKKLIDMHIREN